MRVDLVRSGGVAGVLLRASLDTETLPAPEAAQVERLVRGADLPALVADRCPAGGPDRFQYDLTVHAAGERHQLRVADGRVPPQLRPLLDHLVQVARRR